MKIKEKIRETYRIGKEKCSLFAKKLKKGIRNVLVIGGLFVVILCIANAKINELEANLRAALQEKEHIEVTNVIVKEKLIPLQELATSQFEYTGIKEISNSRELLGVDIPLTTKEIDITYSGIIKVGYDLENIEYEIVPGMNVIIFKLPTPTVSNYILQDSIVCEEKNNIFNPIQADEVSNYLVTVEQEELIRAEQQGLYTEAEQHIKKVITDHFEELDYKTMFI